MQTKDKKTQHSKLQAFQLQCRQAGLKLTPQRMLIYQSLINTCEHPSAEMLYKTVKETMPSISLDTVNRTLLTLADMGAAFIVEGSGDAKRFDGGLENHQHCKCVKCKRIIDFHHIPFDHIAVPEQIEKNFHVLRKTVYFEGLCDKCTSVKKNLN